MTEANPLEIAPAINPEKCLVIVPCRDGGGIEQACESSLMQLQYRGYAVQRAFGGGSIDQVRSQQAYDALIAGYEEIMWIDSDISFHPMDVCKLRAHNLPFTSAVYAKKGVPEFASIFHSDNLDVKFGVGGGLYKIWKSGMGFVHTRKALYDDIKAKLELPVLNKRFQKPLVPWFMPMSVVDEHGGWWHSEDFAFSKRAIDAGHTIYADTTIRLFHIGRYGYSTEDTGAKVPRSNDVSVRAEYPPAFFEKYDTL